MAEDVASLEIRLLSGQVESANDRLDRLEKKSRGAERATGGLAKTFARLVGPAVLGLLVKQMTSVTREFDKLNAGLITATGSADNAAIAFASIQTFATQTPFDLQQVTDSFVKLVNYGLTPSERALTAYGDTSSALGKDLNQLIEAVADAATGEFERLKEFGIKASKQGDEVRFTFRGTTSVVKNSADEIEKYLVGLGENNFAGAMSERMKTLDGAISNLEDEWSKLLLTVSQAGPGESIADGIRIGIDALAELNALVASGSLQAYLAAIGDSFSGIGNDVKNVFDDVSDAVGPFEDDIKQMVDFLADAFVQWPQNVRSAIQIITVEIATLIDKANAYGAELADALDPFSDDGKSIEDRLAGIDAARLASIEAILAENKKTTEQQNLQLDNAKNLKDSYDAIQASIAVTNEQNKKAGIDPLAQFKIKSGGGDAGLDGKAKTDFDRLVKSLRTEEQEILASYQERTKIITSNTKLSADERNALLRRSQEVYFDQLQEQKESVLSGLMSEEEETRLSYERRSKTIVDSTILTETQRQDALRQLQEDFHTEQVEQLQSRYEDIFNWQSLGEERRLEIIRAARDGELSLEKLTASQKADIVLGGLASITSGLAQQSKTAFEVNKKASIGVALIKGYQAAVSAWEAGMSTGGPWAPVVAAGFATSSLLKTGGLIAQIKNTTFGSSGSGGGSVSGGSGGASGSGIPSNAAGITGPGTQQPEAMRITFNLQGARKISAEELEEIAEGLNDKARNGFNFEVIR